MRRGRGVGPGPGRRRAMRRVRRRRRRRILLVGGMVAWGSKKMSQQDVQKIEQSTGKPYEDLSDAEVQQAVTTLNIQPAPLDPAEATQVQAQPEFEEVEVEEEDPNG